jgi:Na+/melibiose symporter-like transporter
VRACRILAGNRHLEGNIVNMNVLGIIITIGMLLLIVVHFTIERIKAENQEGKQKSLKTKMDNASFNRMFRTIILVCFILSTAALMFYAVDSHIQVKRLRQEMPDTYDIARVLGDIEDELESITNKLDDIEDEIVLLRLYN